MQRIGRVAVKDDPSLAGKRTGKVEGTEVVLEDLDEEGGDAYVKIHHPDKVRARGDGQRFFGWMRNGGNTDECFSDTLNRITPKRRRRRRRRRKS